MPKELLIILLLALTNSSREGYGQTSPSPSPAATAHAPAWVGERQALRQALKQYPLSDPAMQAKVVRTFQQETKEARVGDIGEDTNLEWWDDELRQICKKIATTYGNKSAWYALMESNYAPDSQEGIWLTRQPHSYALIIDRFRHSKGLPQDDAAIMLAELLEDCRTKSAEIATCRQVETEREHIISTIRQRILDLPDENQGPTIDALAICGSQSDLAFLDQVADRAKAKKVDPQNERAVRIQQDIIWLCRHAQDKIRKRKEAPQPQVGKTSG